MRRIAVALALIALGAVRAQDQVAKLAGVVRGEDAGAREKAGEGLAAIGSAAATTLAELLGDRRVEVRRVAARGLAALHVQPPPPEEVEVEGGGVLTFREDPIETRYPTLDARVVKALGQALGDEDEEVRGSVLDACQRLGPQGAPVVEPLRKALGRAKERCAAAWALESIGAGAAPALPELIELLRAKEVEARSAAASAIGAIGPAAETALEPLLAAWAELPAEARGAPVPGVVDDPLATSIEGAFRALGAKARDRATALAKGKGPLAVSAAELLVWERPPLSGGAGAR